MCSTLLVNHLENLELQIYKNFMLLLSNKQNSYKSDLSLSFQKATLITQ